MSARYPTLRRPPASMVLLLLGIVLLVGAAYQAYRTARSQQQTVTRVLHSYARVAAWNFEQQAVPVLREAAEPLFHPLHELSFASGEVEPASINVVVDNRHRADCVCEQLRSGTRYGVRFLMSGSAIETSAPVPDSALQTIVREVRAHHRRTPAGDRLTMHQEAMHAFVVQDTVVIVMYSPKLVPGDTVLYALVIDANGIAPVLDRILGEHALLPEPLLEGVANADLLSVSFELPGDGPHFYGPFLAGPHTGERLLPKLGNLMMRVRLFDDAEQYLILGGARTLRGPFLLALLAIAISLLIVAFSQMRREHALAEMRSDFVSSVSHELRTPLALQRIFLDMLRLGRVDTPERRAWCFDNIDRESTRLAHLVENVLHFSRAERGNMRITTERAFLAPVIHDSLAAFEPLAATTQATIDAVLEPDVTAPVDAGALRQMLMNILENAVKYGPAAQRISVRLALVGHHAHITIDDEGTGVPPAERRKIFQPYQRGVATLNTAIAGSGIGLAVVDELAKAHHGGVSVTGAPIGGARFVIELPGALREDVVTEPDRQDAYSEHNA